MTTTQSSVAQGLKNDALSGQRDEPQNSEGTDESIIVHLSLKTYHRDVCGVPACPGVRQHLRKGTLEEAAKRGLNDYNKCQPMKYRALLEQDEGNAEATDTDDSPRGEVDE